MTKEVFEGEQIMSNYQYTLNKLRILDGKTSLVREGEGVTGTLYRVTEYATPNEKVTPEVLAEGDEVLVAAGVRDLIKTSPIASITKATDSTWKVETLTSVYTLERVNDV